MPERASDRFNRRTVLKTGSAAAIVALAGCSSADDETPTSTPDEETPTPDEETPTPEEQFNIDTVNTGDPFADIKTAAGHVEGSAATLSGGFSAALDLEGDASSDAAALRATLTGLLQEHVYLAGYAVDAAYSFGPNSDEFQLAAEALDTNSVELADVIGDAAGEDNREAFLSLWRDHIGFFVDYALAAAEGDDDARGDALDDLDGYTDAAGEFFEDITGGELPAEAVEDHLDGHIDTLAAAIDSFAGGDSSAFDDLKEAGDHVVGGAAVLSGGFAAALDLDGDTSSQSAELRANLTAGLQEHVYLAGIAVKNAYAEGLDSGEFEAAAGTLDTNSVELADGIGELAGDDNGEAFLGLWRDHIGFFVDYAAATAQGDEQAQDDAIQDLGGYTEGAGGFFEDISGGELPADAVAENLRGHIATLGGAIDSLHVAINEQVNFTIDTVSTGDPFADAKTAAGHVEGSAATLSGGFSAALDLEGDTSSDAAALRATLTGLLQEHVYLAGYAVDAAYSFGPESPEFELAAEALDTNSVELADVIGDAAGEDNREAFLSLWRDHIGFFVDYALAAAADDDDARGDALDDLDGYTDAAGEFFEDITGGELPAEAVEEHLDGHIDTLAAAIDSRAAGDSSAFDDLKEAGDHVVGGAAVLSGGFAAALDLDGDTESQSAELRAGLTAGLQEHVYLAGIAVKNAYAEGLDSGEFEAAAGTLDTNSVQLADAIGDLAGDDNREAFLGLWRDHIGFFVDYAVATAQNDEQAQADAIEDLDGYTEGAGEFFEDISAGELPADAVAESLRGHIATLGGAIDSLDAAINQ